MIPLCKTCRLPVRPNILMFNDYEWISSRSVKQERRFRIFMDKVGKNGLTILEIGAGTAVPTIRYLGESVFCDFGSQRTFVRINPEPSQISLHKINYFPINQTNIDDHQGPITENEFIELNM